MNVCKCALVAVEATTTDWISAGGTVFGLILGVLAYNGWKKQLVLSRRFEVAQDVVKTLSRFELTLFNELTSETDVNTRVATLTNALDEFLCESRLLNVLFDMESIDAYHEMKKRTHDTIVAVLVLP